MVRRPALLCSLAILAAPRLCGAVEPTLRADLGEGVHVDLVLIPAGTFTEGSPPGEKGREDGEDAREVRLTEPFYLGKYPVTVGQFARFAAATSYLTEAERGTSGGSGWNGKALVQRPDFNWKKPGFNQTDDRPVTLVTYDDALAFTAWLSRTQGRAFTLPSEAQWEYAYRAGTRGAYYVGATEKDALALGWFKQNARGGTYPVGEKQPNAFGLYDMAGNAFEWCLDWYAPYPTGPAVDPVLMTPPPGPDKARRVLRGGSWLKDVSHGRAAARYRNTPGSRNADNGFRVLASTALVPVAPQQAPPPPPPPPPPTPARAPAGCGTIALGLGCWGTVVGSIVMMLALVIRAFTRSSQGRRVAPVLSPSQIRFQNSADGFRIFAPGAAAGALLVYRYRGPNGVLQGQVRVEPSPAGQFIYTGFVPVDVAVVQLVGAALASATRPAVISRQVVISQQVVHHHHHVDDDDSSFRGFPPAY